MHNWISEFPSAVTVCDTNGIILEMNDKSCKTFEKDGSEKLIGKNLLDCHPEPAKSQLREMIERQKSNVYTIEKNGKKKLIYQSPWFENSVFKGLVEISIEIPFDISHFKRD
jgi:PAS domain S-box-containing protein